MKQKKTQEQASLSEEELRRRKRKSLLKMLIILIFLLIMLVFGSIAWFTMNKENAAGGMGVKIGSDAYEIVPVDGDESVFMNYFNYIAGWEANEVLPWKLTATDHMKNITSDDEGISPGKYGAISFYVKPRDTSINLDLTFQIVGYSYSENQSGSGTPAESNTGSGFGSSASSGTRTMTEVPADLQNYLAGHIFLFESCTPVDENDPSKGYIYSDPILPNTSLEKIIENRTFYRANENVPVEIYWVWAKTLSTLVNVNNEHVNIKPFCNTSGTSYTEIVNHITEYPERFFLRESGSESSMSGLTEQILSDSYDEYGSLFDRADNEIGMKIDYITVKMTSSQSASSGS